MRHTHIPGQAIESEGQFNWSGQEVPTMSGHRVYLHGCSLHKHWCYMSQWFGFRSSKLGVFHKTLSRFKHWCTTDCGLVEVITWTILFNLQDVALAYQSQVVGIVWGVHFLYIKGQNKTENVSLLVEPQSQNPSHLLWMLNRREVYGWSHKEMEDYVRGLPGKSTGGWWFKSFTTLSGDSIWNPLRVSHR